MKILLAGATGYLGGHIARELIHHNMDFVALVRKPEKLAELNVQPHQIIQAELTQTDSLKGCCAGIEIVISTVGITRQRDGLTYMQVDYQANANLLQEALASGVRKFVYVSVLHGDDLRHLQICAAKERFVDELSSADIQHCIIRPGGFFSDLKEFYTMAQKGRAYLFGSGHFRTNPIHGADLAEVIVDSLTSRQEEIEIGGPEILTHRGIAEVAFNAVARPARITYIPDWVRKTTLWLSKRLLPKTIFGPLEFFLHVMAMEMIAPSHGGRTLESYYRDIHRESEEAKQT